MDAKLDELGAHVADRLGAAVLARNLLHGELTIDIARDKIVETLTFLRDDARCRFEVLIDICGVDWPAREQRFDVVYHLLSPRLNQRIRVKLKTDEATPVASVVEVYPAANWFEREAYDMYGILFSGHPDLRRLLTDYGFQGTPAQGLPAHRLCRGALRRRAEARRLRAGRAHAGIPHLRLRVPLGGHAVRAPRRREGQLR